MTIARRMAVLGLGAALALVQTSATGAQSAKGEPPNLKPVKFYVAKGKPDACGPGCSEWIAA